MNARAQAAREAQLLPLQKGDLPEGFEGLMTEPAGLWQLLQDLRRDKVASEHALHARSRALEAMKAHLALLAARYVTHKTAIDAIQTARDAIVNPDSALPAAIAARRGQTVRWLLDGDAAKYLKG